MGGGVGWGGREGGDEFALTLSSGSIAITYSTCSDYCAGKYCTNGNVSGDCAAGFWCKLGSPTAWPNDTEEIYGVICPLGYYCEEGNAYCTLSHLDCDRASLMHAEYPLGY